MKHFFTLLAFITTSLLHAQSGNSTCASAIQICLTQPVTYPAAINSGAAEAGPDYGCLGSANNPAWFLFRINTPGTHNISETNSNARDLDFILYGPFTAPTGNCTQLDSAHTADCSYAGGATETINFTSITTGDYYLLAITNYSNLATNVTFTQTSGTGDFDCEFEAVCLVSLVTATPTACDTLTNQYTLNGSVYTFNAPPTGTLLVSNGTASQTIAGPFQNATSFSLANLPSNGQDNTITATFSAAANCTGTTTFTAPAGCIPCDITIESNAPVCEGETLQFTTTFTGTAQYQWTGPLSFNSTAGNPAISNITSAHAGTYTVLVTGQNCVSERDVEVEVISAQAPQVIEIGNEICEGDILFLGALEVPGGNFTWSGPDNFTAGGRNAQVINATPANSGMYILGMSLNNCANRYDTLLTTVFPRPEISIHGDTVQTPGSSAILYVTGASGLYYYWNFYGNQTLLTSSIYTSDRDTLVAFWNNYEGVIRAEVVAEDANGCMSNPVSLSIQVNNAVGVNTVNSLSGLQVYPNPADAFLQLKNNSTLASQVMLTDIQGKKLQSFQVEAGEWKQISVEQLPSGIYFVHAGELHFPVVIAH